jgi:1-aminocyclopropane-1-carboxylate deaminase/D-cysteine desulfhydrase-like pyridoxal-dependent ACC family enzyme
MTDPKRLKQLRAKLAKLPRVTLATLPTPLEELPRFSKALGGPRIFFKRDDLTGLAFGGNKSRMFEYVLGKVLKQTRHDCVIAGAAVQSNYCRQLAAACAKVGLPLYLVLRKVRPQDGKKFEGNYLLDAIFGAKIQIMEGGWPEQRKQIYEVAGKLRKQGKNPYVARAAYDGDNWLNAAAYAHSFAEMIEQADARKLRVDALYMTSSDTTQAGELAAWKFLGCNFPVVGIDTVIFEGDSVKTFVDIAHELEDRLGLPTRVTRADVNTTGRYIGKAYGQPTPAGIEAIKLIARTEGILCDPVYTGKGLAALIADIRAGKWRKGQNVLFLHTGGAPALFAYADSLRLQS